MKKIKLHFALSTAALVLPFSLISSCSTNANLDEKKYLDEQIEQLSTTKQVEGQFLEKHSNVIYNLETLSQVYPEINNIDRKTFFIEDLYNYNDDFDSVDVNIRLVSKNDSQISARKKITINGFKKASANQKEKVNQDYQKLLLQHKWIPNFNTLKNTRKPSTLLISDFNENFESLSLTTPNASVIWSFDYDDKNGEIKINFLLKDLNGNWILPFETNSQNIEKKITKTYNFLTTITFQEFIDKEFKTHIGTDSSVLKVDLFKKPESTPQVPAFENKYMPSSFTSKKLAIIMGDINKFYIDNTNPEQGKIPPIFTTKPNPNFNFEISANDSTNIVRISFAYLVNDIEYWDTKRVSLEIKFPNLNDLQNQERNKLVAAINKAYGYFKQKNDQSNYGEFNPKSLSLNSEKNGSTFDSILVGDSLDNLANQLNLPAEIKFVSAPNNPNKKIFEIDGYYFELIIKPIIDSKDFYKGTIKANLQLRYLKDYATNKTVAGILVCPSSENKSADNITYSNSEIVNPVIISGFKNDSKKLIDEILEKIYLLYKPDATTSIQPIKTELDSDQFSKVNENNFIQKWLENANSNLQNILDTIPKNLELKLEFKSKPKFNLDPTTNSQTISAELEFYLFSKENSEIKFKPIKEKSVIEAQIVKLKPSTY